MVAPWKTAAPRKSPVLWKIFSAMTFLRALQRVEIFLHNADVCMVRRAFGPKYRQGALVGAAGAGEVGLGSEHGAQVVDADCHRRVVGAVGRFSDGEGALVGAAGAGEVALGSEHGA